ncbi:MAG: OmpA family protein [Candidatus Rokubacteria bacterium]|nr:OmpA family protein [Candidatus Rokubacteria bacterium]
MRRLLFALAVLFALAPVDAAHAQRDAQGSQDHPMVSRFPGFYISEYTEQDFGTYEFELGEKSQKVEGKYWRIDYWIRKGQKIPGPVQIARNYANLFTQRGGKKLADNVDAGGGSMTARMAYEGRTIWLECYVSNAGETYTLTIVEEGGMEQKVEFTAAELAKALREQGSVAIHGILFDTGKATIKPQSEAILAEIGTLLQKDKRLELEIQGHTDNVGAKPANLKLSRDRAAAVRDYLVDKFDVAAERLGTAGFGDERPVAPNTSDDGRAQNRRVELVRK